MTRVALKLFLGSHWPPRDSISIYVFEPEIFPATTAVETLLHDMSITLPSLRIRKAPKVMVKAEFAPATEDMFISCQGLLHHMQTNSYTGLLRTRWIPRKCQVRYL